MSTKTKQEQHDERTASVPYPVTFFLSAQERTGVLRVLRSHSKDRRVALLKALRIKQTERRS